MRNHRIRDLLFHYKKGVILAFLFQERVEIHSARANDVNQKASEMSLSVFALL